MYISSQKGIREIEEGRNQEISKVIDREKLIHHTGFHQQSPVANCKCVLMSICGE